MDISHNQDRFLLYLCVCHNRTQQSNPNNPNNPDEGANPVRPLGVYWILLIMLDIRQMDLSCVYYVKSGLDLC